MSHPRPPRRRGTAGTVAVLAAGGATLGTARDLRAQADTAAAAPSLAARRDTAGSGALDAAARARPAVVVREVGPGDAGRILRALLAGPARVVAAPDTGLTVGRAVTVGTPLVVLRGPLRLSGQVRGDVLVLGDLFLRPGARIDGRAIAIGGGVYGSTLAVVGGPVLAYRDLDAVVTPLGAPTVAAPPRLAVDVRDATGRPVPLLALAGLAGFRLPAYTRIDGLALTFGPELALDTGRVRIEPVVTYRTHLGAIDPGVRALARLGRRTVLAAQAERLTATNDAWIRSDAVNAATALALGTDVRNYYRADRAELALVRRWEVGERAVLEPLVGALVERAWSAPRDSGAASVPFSVLGRRDVEGMARANPAVTGGRIVSAVVGARARVGRGAFTGDATLRVERALSVSRGGRFTQATLDGAAAYLLFGDHRLEAFGHAMVAAGDSVPAQRFAYLGGQGTLATVPLLSQGGDRLAWGEARYTAPLPRLRLPYLGAPTVAARYVAGAAGVDAFPAVTTNVGVRVALWLVRADFLVDPARPERRDFSIGVGLLR